MKRRKDITRRQLLRSVLVAAGTGLAASRSSFPAMAAMAAPPWRIGIYTRPWGQFDYRVALDAIAEAGFKYAGLMTTNSEGRNLVIDTTVSEEKAEKIGEEVRGRGLEIPSVWGGGIPLESVEAGVEGLKRLINNCVAARAKSLLMGGIEKPELYERYYGAIARCCDYAAERKVAITLKPHGGLNATGKQCRKTIESVGHSNFSLWYDPGNIFYYSKGALSPVEDARDVDGLVREGMSVKDFDMLEVNGEIKPEVALTPGQGRVDFPAVMAVLKKGGFQSGDLVVETLSGKAETLSRIQEEAVKARRFVEELVRRATQ
jgi:sugar phosphate isomerase/epimerase